MHFFYGLGVPREVRLNCSVQLMWPTVESVDLRNVQRVTVAWVLVNETPEIFRGPIVADGFCAIHGSKYVHSMSKCSSVVLSIIALICFTIFA